MNLKKLIALGKEPDITPILRTVRLLVFDR